MISVMITAATCFLAGAGAGFTVIYRSITGKWWWQ